jgi:two-component system, LytTR family, sensor kinase
LILLPFVENAFKHGVSESRFSSNVQIDLTVEQGHLHFLCINSKAEDQKMVDSSPIGLSNIRRQLELLYPNHVLTIANTDTSFKVELKLELCNSINA